MQTSQHFTGLGMPVFMAFGWAGEETALKYALEQMELFVSILHTNLPKAMQDELPYYGLNDESQSAYMAASEDLESEVHILFNTRPSSFEIQVALTNKEALSKGLKQITKDPDSFQRLLSLLEPDWTLRVQQIHINEETGDQGHYQDVFKDSLQTLDEKKADEVFEKAAYLNADDKWVTPIYLSQRIPAEQAATMQGEIVPVLVERLTLMAPVITMLQGRSARRAARAATKYKPSPKPSAPKLVTEKAPKPKPVSKDEFTYVTELKPLHIRRGFINLTSEHWPYFMLNARTELRSVTVITDSIRDENSSVWRLQPENVARLVLSPRGHRWMEDNFVAGDKIQLTATKDGSGEIQLVLGIAE
jgi:hypothetical protein